MEWIVLIVVAMGVVWLVNTTLRSRREPNVAHEHRRQSRSQPARHTPHRSRLKSAINEDTLLSTLLDSDDVLILDTETTGLGNSAEVVEIAIIDTTGTTRYVAPVMPEGHISGGAAAIHGFTRKRLKDLRAKPWPEHHDQVLDLIEEAQVVLGWNISFDIRILDQTTEKYELDFPAIHVIDMLALYRSVRQRSRNSLEQAMKDEGLSWEGDAHRAESDCRAVLAIMRKLAAD